jgi:hypothetical protein
VLQANTAIWLNKSVGRVVGGLSIGQLLRGRFLDEYSRDSNSGDLTRKQVDSDALDLLIPNQMILFRLSAKSVEKAS